LERYFKNEKVESITKEYLNGFNWVLNYYFNHKIDEYWFYPYYKSPLLNQLVNHWYINFSKQPRQISLDLKPIEQLLYISPLSPGTIQKLDIINIEESKLKKLKLFVNNHPYYWANLDDIYLGIKNNSLKSHLFDCSTSVFISKCHYYILDKPVDLKQFVKRLRDYLK
jgi:hypothetical protein